MVASGPIHRSRARHAYFQFRQNGEVASGAVPSPIERSWRRCVEAGVADADRSEIACQATIAEELERSAALVHFAAPLMDMLREQVADSRSTVVLTNGDGFVLRTLGDSTFLERVERVALRPGANWGERQRGTNAIGLALAEGGPAVVHGAEHFMIANHFLSCSAAPVVDPAGDVLGVLDVTGDYRSYSPHSLALVRMLVRMLESRMFVDAFSGGLIARIHSRPEFLWSPQEGLLAFAADARLVAADRQAVKLLALDPSRVGTAPFDDLFRERFDETLGRSLRWPCHPIELTTTAGRRFYGLLSAGREMVVGRSSVGRVGSAAGAPDVAPPAPRRHGLAGLDTGDPEVRAVVGKLRRILGRDIPVLIQGETGCGKELLARAIHDDGPRRDQAFMAVNCAAMPEGLIESELFGYEDGAFTGGRRGGCVGRIVRADGGTLFLDEIGDMPLGLQARLLRVLQERVVHPLGATKAIPVDVRLVCATHRHLKELVAAGTFRQDLYYRLNGMCVTLPPLRRRQDLAALVQQLLAREAGSQPAPCVCPEVLSLFARHPWPGNIRQLSNLLRTALAMAGDGPQITQAHLPDDFFEELAFHRAPPVSADLDRDTARAAEGGAVVPAPGKGEAKRGARGELEAAALALIRKTLEQHCGNVSAAARQLGVSRNALYRRLKQIGHL